MDEKTNPKTIIPLDVKKMHMNHEILSNCLAELIEEYVEFCLKNPINIDEKTILRRESNLVDFALWLKQRVDKED